VKRDNYILEEDNVLVTKGHCKARDDRGQDVEELGSSVKLMCLVDQTEKAFVNSLSDHFPPWYQLCVKLMKNVLEIVTLDRFL